MLTHHRQDHRTEVATTQESIAAIAMAAGPGVSAEEAVLAALPTPMESTDEEEGEPTAAKTGMEEEAPFVFACFNRNDKYEPTMWAVWMGLLRQRPKSRLWLYAANTFAETRLKLEAAAHGIHPNRIFFARRAPKPVHLWRHRRAHLFLDSLHYGAHTTASDSMWAGLPVLTFQGPSLASRVAAALVTAADSTAAQAAAGPAAGTHAAKVGALGGLVTHGLKEYADVGFRVSVDSSAAAAAAGAAGTGAAAATATSLAVRASGGQVVEGGSRSASAVVVGLRRYYQ
jgi:hypothetical protein